MNMLWHLKGGQMFAAMGLYISSSQGYASTADNGCGHFFTKAVAG